MTKLFEKKQAQPDGFGFYATAEGRGFLRYCYARYLACQKAKGGQRAPSHGKIGMVVADQNENQEYEHSRTGQALRRWLEEGKPEIWHGDISATIRVCRRLEALISEEPEISQIMEDRTASIKRSQFLTGLTDFFLPQNTGYSAALTRQRLADFSGTYTIWSYGENDRWEPYYYQTPTHCRLELHQELPILAMQEFDYEPSDSNPVIKNRKVGFVVFDDKSSIVRFVISYRDPKARWIEVHRPIQLPDYPIFKPADQAFSVQVYGVNEYSQSGAEKCRASLRVLSRSGIENLLFSKPAQPVLEMAEGIFPSIQWDIMI